MSKVQDLLQQHGIDFLEDGHHHCRPGWVQIRECPHCHSDNYHLGFNEDGRFFSCWRCGGHHPIQTLVLLGLSDEEAKEVWKDREYQTTKVELRKGLIEPNSRGPLQAPHRDYLARRGLNSKQIEAFWQVEGIGISHRLSWRIYIPVIQDGKRVTWTTRAIGDFISQRYISASATEESVSIKKCVYGVDYCLHSVLIVEGPVDAWAVGPGAVALCGTAFTTAQVLRLAKIPFRVVCFDSSIEAQVRANRLCSQLSGFPGETQNVQIDSKDPAEASKRELRELRKIARLPNV
jgi:hypothetical protein